MNQAKRTFLAVGFPLVGAALGVLIMGDIGVGAICGLIAFIGFDHMDSQEF